MYEVHQYIYSVVINVSKHANGWIHLGRERLKADLHVCEYQYFRVILRGKKVSKLTGT